MTGGLLLILNLCQCLNLILSTDLLSLGNPFALRKCPLCPAVTLKRFGTFGSIRRQYFASEVGRVLSHTCELVWNALSESDFRFAWGFAFGLPAVSLSFQRLLCLVVQTYFAPAVQTSTLHIPFRSYPSSTGQASLPYEIGALTLLRQFRGLTLWLHFNAYFASRVQALFHCGAGTLLLLQRISAYCACASQPFTLFPGFRSLLDCGVSTHALYLAFSAYLTNAFQFLLCGGISAFTGVAAVQVLHGLCAPGLTWLTTSGMPTLHWGHWEEI